MGEILFFLDSHFATIGVGVRHMFIGLLHQTSIHSRHLLLKNFMFTHILLLQFGHLSLQGIATLVRKVGLFNN